jgi:hypothetical protein
MHRILEIMAELQADTRRMGLELSEDELEAMAWEAAAEDLGGEPTEWEDDADAELTWEDLDGRWTLTGEGGDR